MMFPGSNRVAEFLSSTGLRRHEAERLKGTDYVEEGSKLYVHVRSGKGGKPRFVPVVGSPGLVKEMMVKAGEDLVFPDGIEKSCPVHYFRAVFADRTYDLHARPLDVCKRTPFYNPQHWDPVKKVHEKAYDKDSVYWCRGDRKGE